MKNKKQLVISIIFTVVSVAAPLLFCGFRIGFIFVDHVVFDSLCYCLWALFILNSFFLLAHLRSCIKKGKYLNKPLFIVNCSIAAVSAACCVAFFIIGKNDIRNFFFVSFETLPYLAAVYALVFFIGIFPLCGSVFKKCTAGFTAAACAICAAFVLPIGSFGFESAPSVFNTGESYHVVFATNDKSIGYISYSFGGKNYTVWDTTTGRKDSSTIHSIEVPYEHLNNNSYTVSAVRATEDIAYGGHLGKKIDYTVDGFTPCPDDGFDMTVITDNHETRVDWESVGKNADVCVFLGDIANGIYNYGSFTDNLIIPAGEATGGKIPVIYARGNHDHRGSAVKDMLKELDFDKYYYRVSIGKYNFTVLDSGEDKDDDNYEYAGYNDYASYYAEQTDWARKLEKQKGYNAVIVHSAEVFHSSEEEKQPIGDILKELGNEFMLCGHNHSAEFVSAENSKTGIPYYICGNYVGKKDLNYTVMHFNEGGITIKSQNTAGDEICSAQVNINET